MVAHLSQRLLWRPQTPRLWVCQSCRGFGSSATLRSGHSRWSTIKHDKGKNDRVKSKERSIITKDIIQASKLYGPDPKENPKLALAIASAKRSGLPKTSIESSIARGQGISVSGAPLEPLTIEAILPPSVAVVIECQTDQKGRALQEIRFMIKEAGGTATPTTYLFEKRGKVVFEKVEGLNVDDYLDQAIEAGAEDIEADEEGRLVVLTEHTETKSVGAKLKATAGMKIESSEIIWLPNKDTMVSIENEEDAKILEDVLNTIREDPSVQEIYTNAA